MATKKPKYTRKQKLSVAGRRATLPDSALSPSQLAERKRLQGIKRDDLNPLYNPTTQLAGHNLKAAAAAEVGMALDPKLAAIDQQINQETTQGNALADRGAGYYRGLTDRAKGVADRVAALGDILKTQTADIGTRGAADLAGLQSGEAARVAADEAARGGSLSGDTSRVSGELAAGRAAQVTDAANANTAAGAQAQNWAGLSNAITGATGMRGGEVYSQLLNRMASKVSSLRSDRTATEATRGQATTDVLDKLRQQSYENVVTQQGLKIKQSDIDAQLAGQASTAKTADKNRTAQDLRNQASITSREGIASANRTSSEGIHKADRASREQIASEKRAAAANKAKTKPIPAGAVPIVRNIQNLASEIQNLGPGRVESRERAKQVIRNRYKGTKKGVPPDDVLSAALDLAYDGHVSHANRIVLSTYFGGAPLPQNWYSTTPGPLYKYKRIIPSGLKPVGGLKLTPSR